MANLRERDEKWSIDIAKTVEWNATLLNTLVSRVNVIDASVARQSDSINVLNDGVKQPWHKDRHDRRQRVHPSG